MKSLNSLEYLNKNARHLQHSYTSKATNVQILLSHTGKYIRLSIQTAKNYIKINNQILTQNSLMHSIFMLSTQETSYQKIRDKYEKHQLNKLHLVYRYQDTAILRSLISLKHIHKSYQEFTIKEKNTTYHDPSTNLEGQSSLGGSDFWILSITRTGETS